MSVPRLRDWRSRLVRYADEVRRRPFAWGTTDCVALMRGGLVALFGDVADGALPRWTSQPEALRLAVEHPPSAWLRRCGAAPVPIRFRQAGDILVTPFPDDPDHLEGLGVVVPPGVLVSTPVRGVELVPFDGLPAVPSCLRISVFRAPDVG